MDKNASEPVLLGVHDGHNSAAALLEGGEITFAMQEERISRYKNQGDLPRGAIEFAISKIQGDAQATVAYEGRRIIQYPWRREEVKAQYAKQRPGLTTSAKMWARRFDSLSEQVNARKAVAIADELRELTNGKTNGMERIEHHSCHAAAAYYGSGMFNEKVLVVTCDGAGDDLCASVAIGDSGNVQRIDSVKKENSIGRLYANITYLMGMVPLEHEYKLMGLAPYATRAGDARQLADIFHAMFEFEPGRLAWRRKRGVPPLQYAGDYIKGIIDGRRFDHIAAGLQLFTEEFLVEWIERCIKETGINCIALSGGVFMNVKANQKIIESDHVERCYIMPSCGDETNALGAAWAQYNASTGRLPKPLEDLYLGDEFNDSAVEDALDTYQFDNKVKIEKPANIEERAAELLASNNIVARFKGRMEFGARSLGNRSIMANASDPNAVTRINSMIKNRDFWMPFTPSVLAERSDEYFIKPKDIAAPYMILTFNTRESKREAIQATVHPADLTARPQEVYEAWNPDYYRLISAFSDLAGEAVILNTSFNLHGEPVVRTPDDAFRVLDVSGLENLAIGPYLVRKV